MTMTTLDAAAATVRTAPPVAFPPTAATVSFPHALPGLPGITGYVLEALTGGTAGTAPFVRLRGRDEGGPTLVLMTATAAPGLMDRTDVSAACAGAGLDPADVAVFFVVTAMRGAEEDGGLRFYVNRRAPVLIDGSRGLGFQVVLPRPDYAVRHALLHA